MVLKVFLWRESSFAMLALETRPFLDGNCHAILQQTVDGNKLGVGELRGGCFFQDVMA